MKLIDSSLRFSIEYLCSGLGIYFLIKSISECLNLDLILVCILVSFVVSFCLYFFLIFKYKNEKKSFVTQESSAKKHLHNTLFVSVSIFWAVTVSIYGNDLKNQIEAINFDGKMFAFAISIEIAIILACYFYLLNSRKEELEDIAPKKDTVEKNSSSINDVIKNYEDCLEDWLYLYEKFDVIDRSQFLVVEKSIISSIEFCMLQMIEVLHKWTNDSGTVLKVNLLNILDAKDLRKALETTQSANSISPEILMNSPFFLFNDNWQSCLERCDKVLINEQSMTQVVGQCDIPNAHFPLCLPYSVNDFNDDGQPMQPNVIGAPDALRSGSIRYVPSLQEEIAEYLEKRIKNGKNYSSFSTNNYDSRLRSYYESDTAASVISIPLSFVQPKLPGLSEDDRNSVKTPFAFASVLNIYAHSNHILANKDVVESYCLLTKPIWEILSKLVSMRLQLRADIEARDKMNQESETEKSSSSGKTKSSLWTIISKKFR